MAILTGKEIQKQIEKGNISISNFNSNNINSNSYNLTLNNKLLVYTEVYLDPKKENKTEEIVIQKEGLLLKPGILYLARVNEYTKTKGFVPIVEGRSSIGRLGISVHPSTGFGDNGFEGYFTLEISVIQPVIIYPNIPICQIVYHTLEGEHTYYKGKYQNSLDVIPCKLYEELR